MRRQLQKAILLISTGVLVISCMQADGSSPDTIPNPDVVGEPINPDKPIDPNNPSDPNTPIVVDPVADAKMSRLKPVVFTKGVERTIGYKKTDSVRFDPITNTNKFRYLKKVEKSYAINPLSVLDQTTTDMIYPGSIIHGKGFIKGKYDPIVLKNGFTPMKLSTSLMGSNLEPVVNLEPTLSAFRTAKNNMLAKQIRSVDFNYVPNIFHFSSDLVVDEETITKSLNMHADVDVMKGLVGVNFGYDWEDKTTVKKKHVMVSFRQVFFNFSVDPKHWTKWFEGNVDTAEFGDHEPLYVSNVDYGRIAYLLIETTMDSKSVKHMLELAIKAEVPQVQIGVDVGVKYGKKLEKLFATKKVRVMSFGGPASMGSKIDSYESFKAFIQLPSIQDLTMSSVPVSHKVRRLKDNSEVKVFDRYTGVLEQWLDENEANLVDKANKDKNKGKDKDKKDPVKPKPVTPIKPKPVDPAKPKPVDPAKPKPVNP